LCAERTLRLHTSRLAGVRAVEPGYKLATCVRIAMLYLEDDDPVAAEGFIKKASALIAGSRDPVLELQYKTSYARIMDAKRRCDCGGCCFCCCRCFYARSITVVAPSPP
jgi:hypothetical protein